MVGAKDLTTDEFLNGITDVIARPGGDEFLVIVNVQNGDDEHWLRAVAAP